MNSQEPVAFQSPPSADTTVSQPPRKNAREGNDSLWKRARRTLGTNSLTFLQPQSRPAEPTSTSGSGPAAPSKRREQVRHAQRTHRQRTQNYIKTLESEVIRLRESETKLIEERDKLRKERDILRDTVILSSIDLPAGVEGAASTSAPPLSDFDMPATVSYSGDDLNHSRLHVNFPQQDTDHGLWYPGQSYPVPTPNPGHQQSDNSQSNQDLPNDFSLQSICLSSTYKPGSAPSTLSATTDMKTLTPRDTLEIAIDFVLELERRCMPHLPCLVDLPPTDPANHLMMASVPLIASAPDTPQVNQTWITSGAIIKELLNLSLSINIEGEITPVEAWHRLHQHPDFKRLDRKKIEMLKHELSPAMRCFGFGAVVNEKVFLDALNRSLQPSS